MVTRHLLHIGYPKTGSTSLQAWFADHPQLRYLPGGLAGFSDISELCRPPLTTHRYYVTSCEHLSSPFAPDRHRETESTTDGGGPVALAPIKTEQAQVCDTLHDIFPDSAVLVVTRGFRNIILSSYSEYVRDGGQLGLAGLCTSMAGGLQYDESHYLDFDFVIGLYERAFGTGRVIVLPFELLRDDPQAFVDALETRLHLTPSGRPITALRPALSGTDLVWYPRISRILEMATRPLGGWVGTRLVIRYRAMIGGPKLSVLTRFLQRLRPASAITAADVPPDVLSHCRGRASSLRGRPEFAPYWPEYLLS